MSLLIEYGDVLDIENTKGETALDVATKDLIEEMLHEARAGEP